MAELMCDQCNIFVKAPLKGNKCPGCLEPLRTFDQHEKDRWRDNEDETSFYPGDNNYGES
jgi:hypothetical protein